MSLTPSRRARAYLALWALLFVIIVLRDRPTVPTVIHRAPAQPFRIDLNGAPWERLTLISGVGESTARRIVAERERCGGFASVEEVMALPGIPDRPFEEAREWLVLGSE